MKLREKTTATLLILLTITMFIPAVMAKGGRDQWGYNYDARIFNGPLGYADENRWPMGTPSPPADRDINTYMGNPLDTWSFFTDDGIYHTVIFNVAGTKLVMKWSWAWHMAVFGPDNIRGGTDVVPWSQVEALYGKVWCTNHDVGSGWIDGVFYPKMTGYSRIVYLGDTTGYTNPIWSGAAVVHKVVNAPGITLVFDEPLYGG